ncbi:MAG: phosphatidate cytidylyltransferase [Hyphomicrobiales bacterium]
MNADPRLSTPGAPAPAARLSNLQLRLITAAVGIPIVLALTWAGGWPFALAAGLVALLAAAEFTHGWLIPSMPIRDVVPQGPLFAASAVVVAGAYWEPRFVWAGIVLAVLFGAAGYSRTNVFGPRKPFRVQAWCLIYVGVLLSTLVLTRDVEQGRKWVFLGILSTFAVDTGAYAVGRAIGRHKLAPRISPGKTREGAAGGYIAGVAAVFALNALFDTDVPWTTMAHFAFVMPIAAQAGDLFESWMKRRMGVKDSSGLLPGHGGFLDRLDSVVFVFPVLYLFLQVRVL